MKKEGNKTSRNQWNWKQKTIEKISDIKSWFFEKNNKIDKPLARLTKKKERTQITSTRNKTGNVTVGPTDTKRVIREYYQRLYAHTFDNLDEMNKFFKTHKLL